jgi:superfamily II DNA or RNA helicase
MIKLRSYQTECIDAIEEEFNVSDTQLVQLPTGSGKTIIFSSFLKRNPRLQALITCPTRDLVVQIQDALKLVYGKDSSYSKHKIMTNAAVSMAYQRGSLNDLKFNTLIVDEAHRSKSKIYSKFVDYLKETPRSIKILGMTATPERLDGKNLLDIFGKKTYSQTLFDLIDQGHLCDLRGYRVKTKHLIDVRNSSNGDLSFVELNKLDNSSRNQVIIDTYTKHCVEKKTLIFCISVDQSERINSSLCEIGIKSGCIHGGLPEETRRKMIRDFASGELRVLTNCQVLTEGFDEPSINALILARPTKSKSLYSQMIGRGVRKFPGKMACDVYDITDEAHNLCHFDTIAGRPRNEPFEYPDGITFRRLHEELISIDEIQVVVEKMDFRDSPRVEFLKSDASFRQLERLRTKGICFHEPITFEEAAFLNWMHDLKEEYGNDHKTR